MRPLASGGVLLDLTPLETISSLRGIGRYVRGLASGLAQLANESSLHVEGVAATPDLKRLFVVENPFEYCLRAVSAPIPKSPQRRRNLLSRYEGFGFPVIEAMACGAPTITSAGSSLDEVAGDGALIVPCREPDALAAALRAAFFDRELRLALERRGIARAATFTWQRCAAQTMAFWQRAREV